MNKKRLMFIKMIMASLLRRRSRIVIALLSIAVGAMILSGLEMIYYDVPRQMSSEFRSYGANMIFTATKGESISEEELKKGIDIIKDNELEGYTGYRYENAKMHNAMVSFAGIDFKTVLKTSPYWHIEGKLPKDDGEILVGAKVAKTFGLNVGEEVTVTNSFEVTKDLDISKIPSYEIYTDTVTGEAFCDHEMEYKISGILDTGGSEEEYVYISLKDLEDLIITKRGFDIVEVSVAAGQNQLDKYVQDINMNATNVNAKLVKRVTESESSVLSKLQALVFIVTVVILILTMICVATTMAAIITERRKEIGLRKALGAYDSDIIKQFMCEGLQLGFIGGIIGAILGYFFANYVSMSVFSSPITFRPLLIPITVVASVLVTGIACMIPIKSAITVDPAIVLKGE